jgi:hypothetical protein
MKELFELGPRMWWTTAGPSRAGSRPGHYRPIPRHQLVAGG